MNIFTPLLLFLQWIFGYQIQLIPLAFFCLYPFKNCFRFLKTKVFFLGFILILIASIIYAVSNFFFFFFLTFSSTYMLGADIVFYLLAVAFLMLYFYIVQEGTVYKLFIFLLVTSYATTFELLFRSYAEISGLNFIGNELYELYAIEWIIIWILFVILTGFPFLKLIKKIVSYINLNIDKSIWTSMNYLVFIVLVIILIFYEIPYTASLNAQRILSIFISFIALGVFFLYFWIFKVIVTERKNAQKQDKLNMMIEMYKQNDQHLKELREIRHELKHHLNAMSLYLNNKDYEGAEKYLDKVLLTNEEFPVKTFSSDNLFNLLLSDYYQRFLKNDIETEFEISVLNKLNIDEYDLIELFTNLFDNAMEAMQQEKNKSKFTLEVKQNGNFLTIRSLNTFNQENLVRNGSSLLTSKENSNFEHGHGINVMKQVADKYNGFLTFTADNNTFNLMINLCLVEE